MKTLPHADGAGRLVLAFGPEEAAILFAPGGMFRRVAEVAPWRGALRFFVPARGGFRLLMVIPRTAIRALLEGGAGHPAEVNLKQHLFDAASPAEWPDFAPIPPCPLP